MGRFIILLEVDLLSQHLALPLEGHFEQDLHVIGYLKDNKNLGIMFDCGYPKVDDRVFKECDWFDFYRYAK